MPLFGHPIPKGITEKEIRYIRSELLHAPIGHGAEKLTETQADAILDLLHVAMSNADTPAERAHNMKLADASEVASIETRITGKVGLQFSSSQRAHVHEVLKKYIDINKIPGLFS